MFALNTSNYFYLVFSKYLILLFCVKKLSPITSVMNDILPLLRLADIAEMDIFFPATKISQPTKVNCDIRSSRRPWCDRWDLNPYGLPHAPQTCASACSATIA